MASTVINPEKPGTDKGAQKVSSGSVGGAVMEAPVYTAAELAENAQALFGVRKECATAALKAAGLTACTVSTADKSVREFLKREVK